MDTRVRKPVGHPMPELAAFIAGLKAAFGDATIDEAVQLGKAGEPTFFARENGRSVGTASPPSQNAWPVDNRLHDRHYCAGCNGACIGQDVRCSQVTEFALKVGS
ncbi:hypothetical protein FAZ95_03420 [Trinickia violacea]|uniref:Uncharacterized protein n=1 Tax=Trinickia violacea TaxID=2571746 RepID=A0A4P8IJF4_9BURK|nr:hypothetical protein [Trinickia violacea]QCP48316.1 hypothetical protein FAZ95_03420 [Trinickia violacea]